MIRNFNKFKLQPFVKKLSLCHFDFTRIQVNNKYKTHFYSHFLQTIFVTLLLFRIGVVVLIIFFIIKLSPKKFINLRKHFNLIIFRIFFSGVLRAEKLGLNLIPHRASVYQAHPGSLAHWLVENFAPRRNLVLAADLVILSLSYQD